MPRPRKTDRPTRLVIYIPESIAAELNLLLFSEAEGKVPHGAMSEFFTRLAEQALDRAKQPTSNHDRHL